MVLASGDFYAAGGFWVSALGAVTGVLGTIAIILVTIWIGRPRRRLLYWMAVNLPLLNAVADVRRKLEVRFGENVLDNPQVLEIGLFNQGRLDIPTTAFDSRKPLSLDVGAPIIEVLSITTIPENGPVPEAHVHGTRLDIGPSLIPRRQSVTFSVLVDGPAPQLTCVKPGLVDVEVGVRRSGSGLDLLGRLPGGWRARQAVLALSLSLALLLLIGLVIGHAVARQVTTTVSCTLSKSLQPGQTAQLTYHFVSSGGQPIGLGAGLYDSSGNDHSTGHGDIGSYTVMAGRTSRTRPVPIPARLPAGRYELDAELWPANEVGANGIQTIATAACGYLTVQ
jgi:hypothetical protein